jgi:hypothetical protein
MIHDSPDLVEVLLLGDIYVAAQRDPESLLTGKTDVGIHRASGW